MVRFGVLCLLAVLAARLDGSSPSTVLLVYVVNSPESVLVANAYATRRAIPEQNRCEVQLPDAAATTLSGADYERVLKTPIRACLESVGKQNILYIVLAYMRPFAVDPGGRGRYALDSYLSDIWDETGGAPTGSAPVAPHRYYADNQAQGNFFHPFVALSEYRKQDGAQLIYSVWRLDAATTDQAIALVDNAIYGETHGLTGQACIDATGDAEGAADWSYLSGNWDLHRAAQFLRQAGFAVTEDRLETEFGTGPSPETCPDAAFYSGWYSLNHYNDAFTWKRGAIGFHLDSASAVDPRGGANWSANAVQRGITVTSGAVAEPYLEGLPRPSGVFRNLLEGATVGDAFLRNTRWLRWQVIHLGDPLYQPFPRGLPPFDAQPGENALFLTSRATVGGSTIQAAMVIDHIAPPGGKKVRLTAEQGSPLKAPEQVTIPERSNYSLIPIEVDYVAELTPAQLTADTGEAKVRNTVVVYPILNALRTTVSSMLPGENATALVTLNRTAPAGGYEVIVSTDRPDLLKAPATVMVPPGASIAGFRIDSVENSLLKEEATVTITASLAKSKATAAVVMKTPAVRPSSVTRIHPR